MLSQLCTWDRSFIYLFKGSMASPCIIRYIPTNFKYKYIYFYRIALYINPWWFVFPHSFMTPLVKCTIIVQNIYTTHTHTHLNWWTLHSFCSQFGICTQVHVDIYFVICAVWFCNRHESKTEGTEKIMSTQLCFSMFVHSHGKRYGSTCSSIDSIKCSCCNVCTPQLYYN